MKGTDKFKETIKAHLDNKALLDPVFDEIMKKPGKNIDDCVTYILNTVQATDCNGFDDDEIYSMAEHYYEDDSVKPGDKIDATVVVNHKVELTEEEKAEAKERAIREIIDETKRKAKTKPETPKRPEIKPDQRPEAKVISINKPDDKKPEYTMGSLF